MPESDLQRPRDDRTLPARFDGDWIGTVLGTNTGNIYLRLDQHGQAVSGDVRFLDTAVGICVWTVNGTASDKLVAKLTPNKFPEGAEPTDASVNLEVGADGKLYGRWEADVGTGGVIPAIRFAVPVEGR